MNTTKVLNTLFNEKKRHEQALATITAALDALSSLRTYRKADKPVKKTAPRKYRKRAPNGAERNAILAVLRKYPGIGRKALVALAQRYVRDTLRKRIPAQNMGKGILNAVAAGVIVRTEAEGVMGRDRFRFSLPTEQ